MQIQFINIDENKENEMFLADWAPSMQGTPAKKNAYKENDDDDAYQGTGGARLMSFNDDDISLVVVATVITVMMMMLLRPMHIRALGAGLMRMDGRQLMVGRPTDAY